MRNPDEIRKDVEVLTAEETILANKKEYLFKELFNASFMEVSWEEAEALFLDILTPDASWSSGPIVRKGYDMASSNAHVVDNHGTLQFWIGGYERKDGFRRGESLFIDRNYADRIPDRGTEDGEYTNRKTSPLPNKDCIIRLKRDDEVHVCKWIPFNPDNYTMPSEGYLGTAGVIEGKWEGIGFHAWDQNESEFIYYTVLS